MNKNKSTILVVEDEPVARERLLAHLQNEGYHCNSAGSVKEALTVFAEQIPDLVLLDIQLPDAADFKFAESIRQQYACGLIIVSSLSDRDDRHLGLSAGADDYICKPFDMKELLLKVKNLALRMKKNPVVELAKIQAVYFNQWCYQPGLFKLSVQSGKEISITKAEHEVLMIFLHNPNRIITRNEFVAGLLEDNVFDRAVDSRISRLKKKLDDGSDASNPIQSIYGSGYLFTAEVSIVHAS